LFTLEEGNYLNYLPLTGSPWDVAISNQNIAYVTMTTDREQCILQVDPDKLCIVAKTVFENSNTSPGTAKTCAIALQLLQSQ
jgi:hypothetical protein